MAELNEKLAKANAELQAQGHSETACWFGLRSPVAIRIFCQLHPVAAEKPSVFSRQEHRHSFRQYSMMLHLSPFINDSICGNWWNWLTSAISLLELAGAYGRESALVDASL